MSSIAPTLSAGLMQAQIIAPQPAVLSNVDVAALMQENKWLKDKVAQYERVLFATHCKVTDRIVLACAMYMAYEQGKPDADNANFATAQYSGEVMSKQLGLSKVTIYNSLKKWEDVGLIQRQQSPVAKDQFGQKVDPKAIPADRQCHWESVSYLTAPLTLTDIPSLPETSYERKAKDKAKATSELAKLAQQLKTLTCPECGANSTLEITCSACGCKTDEHNTNHNYKIATVESMANIQPVIDPTPQEQLSDTHSSTSSTSLGMQLGVQVDNPTIIQTGEQQPAQIEVLSLSDTTDRSSINASLSGGAEGLPVLAALTDQIIEDTPETTIPPLSDVSLKGADILTKLYETGGRFSLVQPKAKAAITRDYLVNPPSFVVVLRHLKAGGNVGLLTGDMSAGMVAVDIDRGLGDFLRMYPEFAAYPRCVRANAPDRGKILIRVGAGQAKHVVLETLSRKAEFIGDKYHVIVAGTHETGAELVLLNADRAIPVLDASKVLAKLVAWVGVEQPKVRSAEKGLLRQTSLASSGTNAISKAKRANENDVTDIRRAAIDWWNADPANQAMVDRLLASCKQSGQYVSIRQTDDTPSTRQDRDEFYKRTWTDWGNSQKLDDFELYCRLSGKSKRALMWEVVEAWRETTRISSLKKKKL